MSLMADLGSSERQEAIKDCLESQVDQSSTGMR